MIIPKLPYWPNGTPFHEGELELQRRFGVESAVAQFAPKAIRPYMPDQHRDFYTSQPFLAVSARDSRGMIWATMIANGGSSDFVTSPDPFTLTIDAIMLPGDALQEALKDGDDLGILGIEFGTKRRNRVNGSIRRRHTSGPKRTCIDFQVGQSFGNCPQYIKPRQWWKRTPTVKLNEGASRSIQRQEELSETQIEQIKNSDTIFVASGYRGQGNSPSYGNDVSHRGGPRGWIKVTDSKVIILPDFSGNDMYNTLGNIVMDNRFGLSVPLFETGGMIQMTGRASIDYDQQHINEIYPGALRLVVFEIDEVVTIADGSLPIAWSSNDSEDDEIRKVQVARKIKESAEVTSFYLRAVGGDDPKLWPFKPGQHLPVILDVGDDRVLMRTYSLSSLPYLTEYRVSVKREPFGQASKFLHDKVQEGDVFDIQKPVGDFVLDESSDRTIVLISAGVGATPVLSMLHQSAKSLTRRHVFWIHGARNGEYHAFSEEVIGLKNASLGSTSSHIVYSKPLEDDSAHYDSTGRITPDLVFRIVPDLSRADFYICGPAAFTADLEHGLQQFGVEGRHIKYETF